MSPPWMPLYIADYRADTAHLTAGEHGAYLLLIMHYWQHNGVPKDDRSLARIACMTSLEWKRARPSVAAFFTEEWRHGRIDVELAEAKAKIDRRSAAGKAGGLASAHARQSSSNGSTTAGSNGTTNVRSNVQANVNQLQLHSQEEEKERKKDDAKASFGDDPKKRYYARFAEVWGRPNSGGMATKLLKAKNNRVAAAMATVELAADTFNPAEYLSAAIRAATATDYDRAL